MDHEQINNLLDSIAEKLPLLEVVGRKQSYITGQELILCGHKTWEGNFIQPNKMYNLWVPIAKGEREKEDVHYKLIDHQTKLKKLWALHGLNGIYHYLRPYLTDEQMQSVKKMFMSVSTSNLKVA